MSGADLSRAALSGADLRGAELRGADLSGADLRGADLSGAKLNGEILSVVPVSVMNLKWDILITEKFMQIGCQRHTHEEWAEFSSDQISEMHSDASEFWQQNRDWLLALCSAHRPQ